MDEIKLLLRVLIPNVYLANATHIPYPSLAVIPSHYRAHVECDGPPLWKHLRGINSTFSVRQCIASTHTNYSIHYNR
jgi:hypothetical protein